ncbi:MAG: transposase [bacterium]|nr:transposase [bacterium]
MWAVLKRTYHGTHHWVSPKHLHRYVAEFCGRHNTRHLDTLNRMATIVRGAEGKRLAWAELVAP